MLVEFPARFFNWLIRATTHRRGTHDLCDANFRSAPVTSRHTATHVALGDDADQLEFFLYPRPQARSRSLNRVSLAQPVPPCLAAYSTKTLRLVSSHHYNNSFSFPPALFFEIEIQSTRHCAQ